MLTAPGPSGAQGRTEANVLPGLLERSSLRKITGAQNFLFLYWARISSEW